MYSIGMEFYLYLNFIVNADYAWPLLLYTLYYYTLFVLHNILFIYFYIYIYITAYLREKKL